MWPLHQNQTWVGDRRGGPCSQLSCPSTCIFISRRSTHIQAHRDTQIMASLWDRENAKATVNVKTCPAPKTHGSPFTPPIGDKGALYFSSYKPLDETSGSQRHRQSEEAPPEHWNHCPPMSLAHSVVLSHSQQHFVRSIEGTDTDKTNYLQHAPVTQIKALRRAWFYLNNTVRSAGKASI